MNSKMQPAVPRCGSMPAKPRIEQSAAEAYRSGRGTTWTALSDTRTRMYGAGEVNWSVPKSAKPFNARVLIANRGEIACKLICEVQRLGGTAIAVYSDADARALHVQLADEKINLPGNTPGETYANLDVMMAAIDKAKASAVLPGAGFLSEIPEFPAACEKRGVAFCGPCAASMNQVGSKASARDLANSVSVPVVPGGAASDKDELLKLASGMGYPVLFKPSDGGGGTGQSVCESDADVKKLLSTGSVHDSGNWVVEKYLPKVRHIELQIFGCNGKVVVIGDRDCTLQRKRQKVVEEGPAANLEAIRPKLYEAAVKIGQACKYSSAGTVEFLVTPSNEWYFIEVNPRLQVEHVVTELYTGIPLVQWMVLEKLDPAALDLGLVENGKRVKGHAIEVRICAEDVLNGFLPTTGTFTHVVWPAAVGELATMRIDSWVMAGTEVSPYYDNLCCKVVCWGPSRSVCIERLQKALAACEIAGVLTNIEFTQQIVASDYFEDVTGHTAHLDKMVANGEFKPAALMVERPGLQSTIQDFGRFGIWDIGCPPNGAMDELAMASANRLLGNEAGAPCVEMCVQGMTVKAMQTCIVCFCGADMGATVDGKPVKSWTPIRLEPGSVLTMGTISAGGSRAYLAVAGGITVPLYLGSASTMISGKYGGLHGRVLYPFDQLPFKPELQHTPLLPGLVSIPEYTKEWTIGVTLGPHGSTDFLTAPALEVLFNSEYAVHYNSNRLGIRLIGPKPEFTRADGGEAGLHPSNLHDYTYPVGALNLTGDLPIFITKDGPSLGGFVCPVTVPKGQKWKLGQMTAKDKVRFKRITYDQAGELLDQQKSWLSSRSLKAHAKNASEPAPRGYDVQVTGELPPQNADPFPRANAIMFKRDDEGDKPAMVIRLAGDENLLLEYGPVILDFPLRFRVHALMTELAKGGLPVKELSPGIRSLLIGFDRDEVDAYSLCAMLEKLDGSLVVETKVPTRILELPMAFDDHWNKDAVKMYMKSVRETAPWLPDNLEFMRRINGLDSIDDVRKSVFQTSYMVFGLGDVYLGAPCAVPVDPRHRLVTSKYNPARTFTPEGTVGIGGVYMCIYGMESPGGYQLIGRTVPIFDSYVNVPASKKGGDMPWLLRQFDQVRFYECSEDELVTMRADYLRGELDLKVRTEIFDLREHEAWLEANKASIEAFQDKQAAAYATEREYWKTFDFSDRTVVDYVPKSAPDWAIGDVETLVRGNVWKWLKEEGATVEAGETVCILEAMKMEIPIKSNCAGTMRELLPEGTMVEPMTKLAYIAK